MVTEMRESKFQSKVIKRIKEEFPGAIVLKNDPNYIQGIPDLLVLHNNHWAALEIKGDEKAAHRPNQDYYISKMKDMSYAAFLCPSNEEDIFHDLQSALSSEG